MRERNHRKRQEHGLGVALHGQVDGALRLAVRGVEHLFIALRLHGGVGARAERAVDMRDVAFEEAGGGEHDHAIRVRVMVERRHQFEWRLEIQVVHFGAPMAERGGHAECAFRHCASPVAIACFAGCSMR